MNTIWKDLDPIFQNTLRKYVAESNRGLFDIIAKAVGFDADHVDLLYLTLQIELNSKQMENINGSNIHNHNH